MEPMTEWCPRWYAPAYVFAFLEQEGDWQLILRCSSRFAPRLLRELEKNPGKGESSWEYLAW